MIYANDCNTPYGEQIKHTLVIQRPFDVLTDSFDRRVMGCNRRRDRCGYTRGLADEVTFPDFPSTIRAEMQ